MILDHDLDHWQQSGKDLDHDLDQLFLPEAKPTGLVEAMSVSVRLKLPLDPIGTQLM